MIAGRAGLSSFDSVLAETGRSTDALTREIAQRTERLMAIRAATAEAYRQLAALRLADAAAGQLDAASGALQQLLAAHASAMARAEAQVAAARATWEAAKQAREAARAGLDALDAAFGRALDAVQTTLSADPDYRRLQDEAERAAAVAVRAAQKSRLAEADRLAKGKPFEADPLFVYLWQRGFGTPAYTAGALTRLLDGFVARVARYEPARRNYATLTGLPGRLAEHAERVRAEAAAAAARAEAYPRELARRAGGPAPAEHDRQQAAFDQADSALSAAEAELRAAQQTLATMATGQDPEGLKASEAIEAALRREDLASLRLAAARTPSPEDDALVLRIERLEQERWQLSQELDAHRKLLAAAEARAAEAGEMRREYRARGLDQAELEGASAAVIGGLLGQVLQGALSKGGFFDHIENARRTTPWAGPGPGPWGAPPRPGGFRTGGSIGGGGFRTGGGF